MLNLVIFGPPGAGKGTQSLKLIAHYRLVHLSTGDILRTEVKSGTELGIKAKALMDKGWLVPDEIVISMIRHKLEQHNGANGFIFDGFPRTTAQAEALDKLLEEKKTTINLTLALEVNDEELTKRILLRGKDSGRTDDQDESIVRNRIAEYNKNTTPLVEYYEKQGKFASVGGMGTVDETFEKLRSQVNRFIH